MPGAAGPSLMKGLVYASLITALAACSGSKPTTGQSAEAPSQTPETSYRIPPKIAKACTDVDVAVSCAVYVDEHPEMKEAVLALRLEFLRRELQRPNRTSIDNVGGRNEPRTATTVAGRSLTRTKTAATRLTIFKMRTTGSARHTTISPRFSLRFRRPARGTSNGKQRRVLDLSAEPRPRRARDRLRGGSDAAWTTPSGLWRNRNVASISGAS